jgi:hypothetical protein
MKRPQKQKTRPILKFCGYFIDPVQRKGFQQILKRKMPAITVACTINGC